MFRLHFVSGSKVPSMTVAGKHRLVVVLLCVVILIAADLFAIWPSGASYASTVPSNAAIPDYRNLVAGDTGTAGDAIEVVLKHLRVDVATTTGRLMNDWRGFVRRQYPSWKIEEEPYKALGRYFVILTRYVPKAAPAIIISPDTYCQHNPRLCPPDRRPG